MKTSLYHFAAALFLGAFSFSSCVKDKCSRTVTYIQIEPVYKTLEEIHNGTAVKEAPRELENPGQLYYYDNTMFVVEKGEGIHVIDNTDPANPQNKSFIKIPGNEDLGIKDGLLYANSFIDLLVIDLQNFQVVGRAESAFQPWYYDLSSDQVIVEYKEVEVTEELSCDEQQRLFTRGGFFYKGGAEVDVLFAEANNFDNSSSGGGIGIAGSLAHFSIIGDYLYTIQHDGYSMDIFDLNNPTSPVKANTVDVGVHLETLFPHGDKLFIGSNVGMYIYDNSDPTNPIQLSVFEHARACDPVFVYGDYAYVTLWNGNECGGGPNQLDVIDISDLTNPILKNSFAMENPHGLSVKENVLLLCEGEFGLKTFDSTDPTQVGNHLLGHAKEIHATDIIALPGSAKVAMVIGEDGFYQYSFDDPSHVSLLSMIPVKR